jgi:hypothetical protein
MKKNFILPVLCSLLLVASCKKYGSDNSCTVQEISLAGALVVKAGTITSSAFQTLNGVARIYLQTDGKYVLGLEQVSFFTNNDLSVYLSPTPAFTASSKKTFSFKQLEGAIYIALPNTIDVKSLPYLLVQSDLSEAPVAIAELR